MYSRGIVHEQKLNFNALNFVIVVSPALRALAVESPLCSKGCRARKPATIGRATRNPAELNPAKPKLSKTKPELSKIKPNKASQNQTQPNRSVLFLRV